MPVLQVGRYQHDQQSRRRQHILALRAMRTDLESVTTAGAKDVSVSARAAAASRCAAYSIVLTWGLAMVGLLGLALSTASSIAWVACAILAVMPALMSMVLAHTPAKTIAEIIRDVEAT
jgi:hypothetical protein